MFFSRRAGIDFVDRGDIVFPDYADPSLVKDGAWHDLDISGIVGAKKCLVLLSFCITATLANKKACIRTKGNVNYSNVVNLYTQAANTKKQCDIWVFTNSSGILEYYFDSTTWGGINITVRAWSE